jgi:hypothetical protein
MNNADLDKNGSLAIKKNGFDMASDEQALISRVTSGQQQQQQ